jgi:hypothetical protein
LKLGADSCCAMGFTAHSIFLTHRPNSGINNAGEIVGGRGAPSCIVQRWFLPSASGGNRSSGSRAVGIGYQRLGRIVGDGVKLTARCGLSAGAAVQTVVCAGSSGPCCADGLSTFREDCQPMTWSTVGRFGYRVHVRDPNGDASSR